MVTTKIWRKGNCLLRQPFRQILVVVSPIFFSFSQFLPSFLKKIVCYPPIICLTIFTPELFNEHHSFQCNYRLLHQFASFSHFSYLQSFFFQFQQGQLPAAPTLPPIFDGRVANYFSFSQFLPSFFKIGGNPPIG